MTTQTQTWQNDPAAIALFDAAWLATVDGADFPYDIEAQLEALADGDCVISCWDKYVAARISIERLAA